MNDERQAIGHNAIANLEYVLRDQYEELADRVGAMVRALEQSPPVVDDESNGANQDIFKDADALWKEAEAIRVSEKAPFRDGASKVDAYFNRLLDQLKKASAPVHRKVTDYLSHKKREAERIAREEAERKRREAAAAAVRERMAREKAEHARNKERADAQAEIANTARATQERLTAEANAAEERAANVPREEFRGRGRASSATLQSVPKFTVLDYGLIPLEMLRPYLDQGAIDKALKAYLVTQRGFALRGDGEQAIPGVRFYVEDEGRILR